MIDYYEQFRLNIKHYREKRQMSQIQLSIQCNCGTGTIGGIESGKARPSFEMILKIAEALNVSPADLFERDSSKTKFEIKNNLEQQFKEIIKNL